MPDEKAPPAGKPGEKPGEAPAAAPAGLPGETPVARSNEASGSSKLTGSKSEKGWGNEKESSGTKKSEVSKEVGVGPLYKKTWIDTDADAAHQKKYSTKEGDSDLTYRSWLNAKVSGEALAAAYDPEKKVAKATLVAAKAEGSLLHLQTGVKVDVGKVVGDAIKRLIFGELKVPAPNPPTPPAPMAARVGDMTAHGSPLAPGTGSPNVFIGAMPAWRALMDVHLCPVPGVPHGGGVTTPGAATVFINGFPAARASDFIVEPTGGPNVILLGCPTVMIGMSTATPAGGPPKPKRSWLGSLVEDGLDLLSGRVLFESVPSADLGKAEVELKAGGEVDLSKGEGKVELGAGAMVAAAKGEIPLKVRLRIPFTNQFLGLGLTGEGTLLSAGAEANARGAINKDGKLFDGSLGAKAGAGVGGLGVKASVDIAPAGEAYPHLAPAKPSGEAPKP
jgi:uncharacterized Zn-binding protein involved in type VI secretion